MRFSQAFIPTLREVPADAEVLSHRLMLRAGMIRQLASGVFTILPLGLRVLRKVERIVREEMDRVGAQELVMPSVQPKSLWDQTGRWDQMVAEKILLHFQDRGGRQYCYGPTHEEVVTDLASGELRSYKQLPIILYQIQTKFRDEIRPRFGLMRGREFVMKDAYSFDVSKEAAMKNYEKLRGAYLKIFKRCALNFRMVEASTGAMGGSHSHEFQVIADVGEDLVIICDSCDYAANVEMAEIGDGNREEMIEESDVPLMEVVDTPGLQRVEDVAKLLKLEATHFIKTLLCTDGSESVALMVRGNRDLNEDKAKRYLGWDQLELVSAEQVQELTGAPVGFAGPHNLSVRLVADSTIRSMGPAVIGANCVDQHYKDALLGRDFQIEEFADISNAKDGDRCARCEGGTLKETRGIEVGHTFYLGTKYSKELDANILDESGREKPIEMGCYGVGIGRTAAAIIEQYHDDRGIQWPLSVAPYQVVIVSLDEKRKPAVAKAASQIYSSLSESGVEVLYDDREESAGVKFSDADLIGIPLRVIVGPKSLEEGKVEVKWRAKDETELISVDQVEEFVRCQIQNSL